MTNYQTRLIALSIICGGIAAGSRYEVVVAGFYMFWSGLDTLLNKES